jgi:hypothetical protein
VSTTPDERGLYEVLVEAHVVGYRRLMVRASSEASARRRALRILRQEAARRKARLHDGEDHGTWATADLPAKYWIVSGPQRAKEQVS